MFYTYIRALISGSASVAVWPPEGPPGGPPEAMFFAIYALIHARKPSNKARLNASRTSKRHASCLGMSWRRNELIPLTLPKSGVARTVCYVNYFVQPMANTKMCLPINNYGKHRKAPFNVFSATANRRKCLKKSKSLDYGE